MNFQKNKTIYHYKMKMIKNKTTFVKNKVMIQNKVKIIKMNFFQNKNKIHKIMNKIYKIFQINKIYNSNKKIKVCRI